MGHDASKLQVPPGFALVKKGGRPKKEARDAAVFLAKLWRIEHCGDSATAAEKWIVDTWESAGTKASKGIGETAHVRAAVLRARRRGLNQSFITVVNETGVCSAVECAKTPAGATFADGALVWLWVAGMTMAAEGKVKDLAVSSQRVTQNRLPIAQAVADLANQKS